jgi:uncharacterized membrane protein YkoI
MLRKPWKPTGPAAVIPASLVLGIGALADRQMADKETAVTLEQVLHVVQATLLGQGRTIQEIEMQTENGQTVYEADIIVDGQEREVKLAADGSPISKEDDDKEANDDED